MLITLQYLSSLIKHYRIQLSIGIAVLLIGVFYIYSNSVQKASTPSPTLNNGKQLESSQSYSNTEKPFVSPKDFYQEKLRDPFIPPESFSTTNNIFVSKPHQPNIGNTAAYSYQATNPQPAPILTGIISSKNGAAAIVEYNGESKYLRINDKLGPYKLVFINSTSIKLKSSNGSLITLHLRGN